MMNSKPTTMSRLLRVLDRIEQAKIAYRLEHVRDSIMIVAAVPGERWEIEFLRNGDVEIERFLSGGVTAGQELLESLIATHGASSADANVPSIDGAIGHPVEQRGLPLPTDRGDEVDRGSVKKEDG